MKKKKIYYISVVASFLLGLALWTWFKAPDSYSEAERRPLDKFPQVSTKKLLNGRWMTDFESYTLDQFPMRDTFRSIKAFARLDVFAQKDNNGIYTVDGYTSKLEYPMNEELLDYAAQKFQGLYDKFMADTNVNVYFCIIPDKNYYLAAENGYLSMDYDTFYTKMQEQTSYMEFVDIRHLLDEEDYYFTDTHWKQPQLLPVANALAAAMNGNDKVLNWEYEEVIATQTFQGVYVGQSASKLKPDTLSYLTNAQLEACTVTSYNTGSAKEISMYDLEAVHEKDAYELFLNGADPLVMIENPNASTDKELVIFRDSFGSSLTPLLVENYAKITMVDIRYMDSALLGRFVEFTDQDVLFLYSTLVLNASSSFR